MDSPPSTDPSDHLIAELEAKINRLTQEKEAQSSSDYISVQEAQEELARYKEHVSKAEDALKAGKEELRQKNAEINELEKDLKQVREQKEKDDDAARQRKEAMESKEKVYKSMDEQLQIAVTENWEKDKAIMTLEKEIDEHKTMIDCLHSEIDTLEDDLEKMKFNVDTNSSIVQQYDEVMEKLRTIFAEVRGSEDWTMDDFLKVIKERNFGMQVRAQGDRNISGNSLAEELGLQHLDDDDEMDWEDPNNRASAEVTERPTTTQEAMQSEYYNNLMLDFDRFEEEKKQEIATLESTTVDLQNVIATQHTEITMLKAENNDFKNKVAAGELVPRDRNVVATQDTEIAALKAENNDLKERLAASEQVTREQGETITTQVTEIALLEVVNKDFTDKLAAGKLVSYEKDDTTPAQKKTEIATLRKNIKNLKEKMANGEKALREQGETINAQKIEIATLMAENKDLKEKMRADELVTREQGETITAQVTEIALLQAENDDFTDKLKAGELVSCDEIAGLKAKNQDFKDKLVADELVARKQNDIITAQETEIAASKAENKDFTEKLAAGELVTRKQNNIITAQSNEIAVLKAKNKDYEDKVATGELTTCEDIALLRAENKDFNESVKAGALVTFDKGTDLSQRAVIRSLQEENEDYREKLAESKLDLTAQQTAIAMLKAEIKDLKEVDKLVSCDHDNIITAQRTELEILKAENKDYKDKLTAGKLVSCESANIASSEIKEVATIEPTIFSETTTQATKPTSKSHTVEQLIVAAELPLWLTITLFAIICFALTLLALGYRERRFWLTANDLRHRRLISLTSGTSEYGWLYPMIEPLRIRIEDYIGFDRKMMG